MRRWWLLSALLLSGCARPAVPPPSNPPAPVPPPPTPAPVVALPSSGPSPAMAERPPVRDPFSLPVPPAPPPSPPPPSRPPVAARPSSRRPVEDAPAHLDYTVAGIFRGPRGAVALLAGQKGSVLVAPGSRLDGDAVVSSIDPVSGQVSVRWGSRRYVLPLHPHPEAWHTDSGQDRRDGGTNTGGMEA